MIMSQKWRRWGAIAMTSALLGSCVNAKFKTNEPLRGFDASRVGGVCGRAPTESRQMLRVGFEGRRIKTLAGVTKARCAMTAGDADGRAMGRRRRALVAG